MSAKDIERLAKAAEEAEVAEMVRLGATTLKSEYLKPVGVRAILQAMRETTDGQYDALCATGKPWREQTSETVWQTYIDALLQD